MAVYLILEAISSFLRNQPSITGRPVLTEAKLRPKKKKPLTYPKK